VVITNDDTLSAADIALGYKGGWIIESCFRRMKQTGLQVRPMFHWTARRIEAHVKLCVLALQMQRAAEIRCAMPWARIAHELGALEGGALPGGWAGYCSAHDNRRRPCRIAEKARNSNTKAAAGRH
jgi:hypothetical protein